MSRRNVRGELDYTGGSSNNPAGTTFVRSKEKKKSEESSSSASDADSSGIGMPISTMWLILACVVIICIISLASLLISIVYYVERTATMAPSPAPTAAPTPVPIILKRFDFGDFPKVRDDIHHVVPQMTHHKKPKRANVTKALQMHAARHRFLGKAKDRV